MDLSRFLQAARQGCVDPHGVARYWKDSPSTPPAPDYKGAADATAAGNLQMSRVATQANRPNEYTPLGSRTWTNSGGDGYSWNGGKFSDEAGLRTALGNYATKNNYQPTEVDNWMANQEQYGITKGDPDKWTSQINLSPEGQQLFDQQMRISQNLGNVGEAGLNRVGEAVAQPFDMSKVPGMPSVPTAGDGGRNAVVQALMQRQQPAMDRARQSREANLIAQGHTRGGSAWDAQQDDLNRAENDARLAAEIAGGQEQSRQFGLEAQRYGMGTDARGRAISEQAYLRNLPLSELNSLRTGAQPAMPTFQPYSPQQTTAGPNLSGAASAQGQYDMGLFNSQNASQSGMMGGLIGMGMGALGAPINPASGKPWFL